jgi:hypothetical protein
MQAREIET